MLLCTCIKVSEGGVIIVVLAFIDIEVVVSGVAEAEEVIDTIMALSIFYCVLLLVFCSTRYLLSWRYFLPCYVHLESPQQLRGILQLHHY